MNTMSQRTERRGIHLDQSELLCKKGCGFYGNTAWQGLCSKCWREENQRERQKQIQEDWALAERLQREEEEAYATRRKPPQSQPAITPFSKFEERKTKEKSSKVNTVTKFFTPSTKTPPKKDNAFDSQSTPSPSSSSSRHSSADTDHATREFIDFLKPLKSGREIFKQCRAFTESMVYKRELGADELSECVQDFYQNLSDRLQTQFKGSTEHVESVMDAVEKYMMTRLYKEVFCPETTDDEKKDLAIQKRIRALHWVTIEMLCVPVDEDIPEVSDSVVKAITVISTVLLIHWEDPLTYAIPYQPVVEIITGHSKVFTGETVKLKCIPPATPYKSTWTFAWYNGPQQLPHFGETLVLSNIKTKDNGKYYCQSSRDTSVQDIPTIQSVPIEISVDGGWAILDTPSQSVVGYPMNMTCRIRGSYPIHEVILYRNGVEVLEQEDPKFILKNLTLEDWGQYTCRASWNKHSRTHSVISAPVSVQVVEPLTEPTLFIVDDDKMRTLSKLKLLCVLDYNIPEPAPPVLYYFYINSERAGTATTDNSCLIERIRGTFKCKAVVSQLGLTRWSEPKTF